MTPQFLTVKIQALMEGRLELSDVQKRSLALEYFRQCAEAEKHIEHCVSLIKTGREYPAIQVAEASNLLDTINALIFPKHVLWREFCQRDGLPVPSQFDDEQIILVSSLYSKGITQAHPLYRDYRRAMRKRDWKTALSVIRTISKINSYDAEAAREYGKLRKRVCEDTLSEISDALKSDDKLKICRLCESIEADAELFSENPIWQNALAVKRCEEEKRNAEECKNILSELSVLNPEKDWERVTELVTRFDFARGDMNFTIDELSLLEKSSKEASKYQDESISKDKSARACNLISIELDGNSKTPTNESLKKLESLVEQAGIYISPDLLVRVRRRIGGMRRSLFIRGGLKFAVRSAAVLAIIFFLYAIADKIRIGNRLKSAYSELDNIALIDDADEFKKSMDSFNSSYPELLNETSVQSKMAALRGNMDVIESDTARLFGIVEEIEKSDLKSRPSGFFDAASNDLERAYSEMSGLSRRNKIVLKGKIESLTKKLNAEIESRKVANSEATRTLLDKYEALLNRYASFSGDRKELDDNTELLLSELRPLMEDKSFIFKAHQIDLDRYNDLSARIADARAKFSKFDSLRDSLLSARNSDEYIAALDMVSVSGEVPPEFSKKISKIARQKDAVRIGNLADFIDISYAGESAPDKLAVYSLPENKTLVDVWAYSHPKRGIVYTLGEIRETSQKWRGGGETVQYAEEISLGGRASTMVYRLTEVSGKGVRGELLSSGSLTLESQLGRSIRELMQNQPAIAALKVIRNTNVNSVYRAYLENIILSEMSKNPVESGLAFSPSARIRAEKVRGNANALFDYSWMFEKPSKMKYLAETLYSSGSPDYFEEARTALEAFKMAQKNPLRLIGICDEKGVPQLFDEPKNGALRWGVGAVTGLFQKLSPKDSFVPLSPIFEETKSKEEILKAVSK